MDDQTIYDNYAKFARLVGSPVMSFEDWSRARANNFAADREADKIREKWLNERS